MQTHNPFTARIIRVNGDLIYIDAGLDSGLKKGETLDVMREENPIDSGGKLVVTHTKLGNAKITEVNHDYSICQVGKHTGTIHTGDIVKRRQ